jgi:hypothetical protein
MNPKNKNRKQSADNVDPATLSQVAKVNDILKLVIGLLTQEVSL